MSVGGCGDLCLHKAREPFPNTQPDLAGACQRSLVVRPRPLVIQNTLILAVE